MRSVITAFGAIFSLSAATAAAQTCITPPTGGTDHCAEQPTLHLPTSAAQKISPNELVADPNAVGTAPTAVMAQRRVNTLMAKAAANAKGAPGIRASFKDYLAQFVDERGVANGGLPHWIAQQTLELRGTDSETLLDLVGQLQSTGLAIGRLDWQVSAGREQQARRDATIAALTALRAEATAAAALGMAVDHYRSVTIDGGPQVVRIEAMAGATMMAPATPAPKATPEKEDITASASAEVVLRSSPAERRPTP